MSDRPRFIPVSAISLKPAHKEAWTGDLVVAVAALVGCIVVTFRGTLIPDRFSLDGEHLRSLALGFRASDGDRSYESVATIYRVAGLAQSDLLTGLSQFTVCAALTIWVYRMFRKRGVRSTSLALTTALTLFFGSVYLGFYSKDFFVLAITATVLLTARTVWIDVAIVALMSIYASGFRNYWWAVMLIYVAGRLWGISRRPPHLVLAATVGAAIIVGLALSTVGGIDPDHFRTSVNISRAGDAQSVIEPFVTLPQPLGGLVNIAVTVLTLMVPVPLLTSAGGVYYLLLSLTISVLWLMFFHSVRVNSRRLSASGPGVGRDLADARVDRATALVVAFLAVQAVFEPDYGSALRHLTPLMPLFASVAGYAGRAAVPQSLVNSPVYPGSPSDHRGAV